MRNDPSLEADHQRGILALYGAITNGVYEDLDAFLEQSRAAKSIYDLSPEASPTRRGVVPVCELIVAVAATASYASYMRPGELVDLPAMTDLTRVTAALDEIRGHLQRMAPTAPAHLRRGKFAPAFARSITTLMLALDACPPALTPQIVAFSPVSPASRDPQGDAQLAASDHFDMTPVPIFDEPTSWLIDAESAQTLLPL